MSESVVLTIIPISERIKDIVHRKLYNNGNKYTIEADIGAKLVDPRNGKVLAKRELNFERGFPLTSPDKTRKAFDAVFNDLQKQLLSFIQSNEFQTAVE